jgi:hypothetical protein
MCAQDLETTPDEKRQKEKVEEVRNPDAADAYLGLGTANYIIGSLPGSKKLFLGFAGIHGDKKKGIEQLEIAAKHGHYLRPFAKILLALTALREKKPEVARAEFMELVAEFPENPLFGSELAKLNGSPEATIPISPDVGPSSFRNRSILRPTANVTSAGERVESKSWTFDFRHSTPKFALSTRRA